LGARKPKNLNRIATIGNGYLSYLCLREIDLVFNNNFCYLGPVNLNGDIFSISLISIINYNLINFISAETLTVVRINILGDLPFSPSIDVLTQ